MSLPLVFDAPGVATPPRHLADLDRDERRAAVVALGLPPFRADQLSRQYFGRLESDTAAMTELPVGARRRLGDALLPSLLTQVRQLSTDAGATRKSLWRLYDGTLIESVLMRSRSAHRVRVRSGRVWHGVPVLRDRPGWAAPESVRRRDRRAGRCRGALCCPW